MRALRTFAGLMLIGCAAAGAQDIAGVEDCTKTSGLDRRTGCLQANVNFLQRTMSRNASEASRRLQAAESEIVALKVTLAELRRQVEQLTAAKKSEPKVKSEPRLDEKKK